MILWNLALFGLQQPAQAADPPLCSDGSFAFLQGIDRDSDGRPDLAELAWGCELIPGYTTDGKEWDSDDAAPDQQDSPYKQAWVASPRSNEPEPKLNTPLTFVDDLDGNGKHEVYVGVGTDIWRLDHTGFGWFMQAPPELPDDVSLPPAAYASAGFLHSLDGPAGWAGIDSATGEVVWLPDLAVLEAAMRIDVRLHGYDGLSRAGESWALPGGATVPVALHLGDRLVPGTITFGASGTAIEELSALPDFDQYTPSAWYSDIGWDPQARIREGLTPRMKFAQPPVQVYMFDISTAPNGDYSTAGGQAWPHPYYYIWAPQNNGSGTTTFTCYYSCITIARIGHSAGVSAGSTPREYGATTPHSFVVRSDFTNVPTTRTAPLHTNSPHPITQQALAPHASSRLTGHTINALPGPNDPQWVLYHTLHYFENPIPEPLAIFDADRGAAYLIVDQDHNAFLGGLNARILDLEGDGRPELLADGILYDLTMGDLEDDDGDGRPNWKDCAPNDPNVQGDLDGDTLCADIDCDDNNPDIGADWDGDGACWPLDCAPHDPTITADLDGDGVCAPLDCDDADPSLQADVDGDGVCAPLDCDDDDPNVTADVDGDGSCAPLDCNDNDAAVHPEATEVACDDLDQDCSGADDCPDDCPDDTDSDSGGDTANPPGRRVCATSSGSVGWLPLLGVLVLAGRRRRGAA